MGLAELDTVSKRWGSRTVLENVSLRVMAGEAICLSGPPGSGKTTLLEILAGLLRPDAGRRIVRAEPIGYMFQDDALVPWMTVEENVTWILSSPEERAAAEAWIEQFGLGAARAQRPAQISGGMRRLANLARALAVRPALLLLDEPLAFLDRATQEKIGQALRPTLKQGVALVVASHDPRIADWMEARRLVLNHGRLEEAAAG